MVTRYLNMKELENCQKPLWSLPSWIPKPWGVKAILRHDLAISHTYGMAAVGAPN